MGNIKDNLEQVSVTFGDLSALGFSFGEARETGEVVVTFEK
jgi:hypothetical protein